MIQSDPDFQRRQACLPGSEDPVSVSCNLALLRSQLLLHSYPVPGRLQGRRLPTAEKTGDTLPGTSAGTAMSG